MHNPPGTPDASLSQPPNRDFSRDRGHLRLAIINHGRLEQVGGPADMYDRPATRLDGE
jgi:hypothetical protein